MALNIRHHSRNIFCEVESGCGVFQIECDIHIPCETKVRSQNWLVTNPFNGEGSEPVSDKSIQRLELKTGQ